jgi:hypothetical protein
MRHPIIMLFAVASLAAAGANAQTVPRLPDGIGGLPNLSGIGLPNVAGVLGYCAKNRLLAGSGFSTLVEGLGNKPGVKTSPDYRQGMTGTIIPGSGSPLSLNSLPSSLQTQACEMVMDQGTKLL